MKYGERFKKESAPQWSLHNIDYDLLEHRIKVRTTPDQLTAMAVQGQQGAALRAFEDEFYGELCRQYDRVDLFVSSKADEIGRRLQHLSSQIHGLLVRCAGSRTDRMTPRRHRRFAKHENALLGCGDDIQSLRHFVGAQAVAFQEILKKYGKWTGSSNLGLRFGNAILSHSKSFTRRDFSQLQSQYGRLLGTLRAVFPAGPDGVATPYAESIVTSPRPSEQTEGGETIAGPELQQTGCWNEYDHGSDVGDAGQNADTIYMIYIGPSEEDSFWEVATITLKGVTERIKRIGKWIARGHRVGASHGRGHLLASQSPQYGTTGWSYLTQAQGDRAGDTMAEEDTPGGPTAPGGSGIHGYASSEEFPMSYKAYYSTLPTIESQNLDQHRERVLRWGTWSCFATSFFLSGIAALLVTTGHQNTGLEVDAGMTLGIMASLGAACAALGMTFSREEPSGWIIAIVVWALFATACVLNCILLVLLVGSTQL